MLLRASVITEEQLKESLQRQRELGGRLGTHFQELGYLDENTLLEYLSKQLNVPYVKLSEVEITDEMLNTVPPELAQKYEVIPFERHGKTLKVATVNPLDVFALDDIRFKTGYEVEPYVATEKSVRKILEDHYKTKALEDEVMDEMASEEALEIVGEETEEEGGDLLLAQIESGPVVKYVNYLLKASVKEGASDIHIEPYEKDVRVRARVDGLLREIQAPPVKFFKAVVSRIKVMGKMKIQEKRLPQDGRFEAQIDGKKVDFRISTIPTLFGEKIALRVLDRSSIEFDLRKLGFEKEPLEQVLKAIKNPFGIILVTGPTGSGKTTTLYSILNEINEVGINITTAEDPVEFTIMGVNQLQVNEAVGNTFANALRAYLRQDPDVIMVGEIRDRETTEIAIRAALTGHLVLSTVHTNTAAATITRLINMGVEPFLIASTILLIVSQRLIRKVCDNCKMQHEVKEDEAMALGFTPEEIAGKTIYKGAGCDKCGKTGYKGRAGIFEVMPTTPKIRNLIIDRATDDVIEQAAVEEGMMTLREAAKMKLYEGITDIYEVSRETSMR